MWVYNLYSLWLNSKLIIVVLLFNRENFIQKNVKQLNSRIVSSCELAQGPLQSLHINYQCNETSIDIKDSKFVDHLYIDWPVAKRQYASKATETNIPL